MSSGRVTSRLRVAAALAVLLGGCRLIDQRTFETTGSAPSAASLARSAELASGRPVPLVTVFPGRLGEDWQPAVLAAVRDAIVRKPDASFDIVAAFPTAVPAAAQRAAIETGSADAASVASVIEADGVAADRLHLGARGDSGRPGRQVMIYLR